MPFNAGVSVYFKSGPGTRAREVAFARYWLRPSTAPHRERRRDVRFLSMTKCADFSGVACRNCCRSFLIDDGKCDVAEFLIGLLFFFKRFVQQCLRVAVTQIAGEGFGRAV